MLKVLVLILILCGEKLLSSECDIKSLDIDWEWTKDISLDFEPRNVDKDSSFHLKYIPKRLVLTR